MAKYLYVSMVKWSPGFTADLYNSTWKPKHDELAKKHGLELKYMGTPFGCSEDACLVYESDTEVDGYRDFRMAIAGIEGGATVSANTTIVALQ